MKKIFWSFLFVIFSLTASSQNLNCKKIQNGKFEINSEISGKTEILRTKNIQIETNDSLHVKVQYDVSWIDDCTYELKNRKLLSGTSKFNGEVTDVIKVQILKIEGNRIFIRTSANFSDQTFDTVVDLISN